MSNQQTIYIMQRIGTLLFRRLHDELSKGERMSLESWLNQQDEATRLFFNEATEWNEVEEALKIMYEFNIETAFLDVQKKIEAEAALNEAVIILNQARPPVRRYKWFSIAATFVLIVGGVWVYTIVGQNDKKASIKSIAERYKNDVAPGDNKATLQLADGHQIVLDGASNGQLATQGSTKVLKLANGELAYQGEISLNTPVSYNVISTPKGGQYQVTLPDGSKVWLNAASMLKFPTSFSGKDRVVALKGEAYFDIAKNPSAPFKVLIEPSNGKATEIEVLGTGFDVKAYSDEADQRTTLVEGAVKVKSGGKELELTPGNQARIKDQKAGGAELTVVKVNTDEVLAWKNGLFQFNNAPIQNIMQEAARWYNIEVKYKDEINQQFVGTIPRRVNLSTLLKILESTGAVHFTIEGNKITVEP